MTETNTQQPPATTNTPTEQTFELGDGTVVKAANYEEAFKKVAEMKVNTAAALRDREQQIRQLQTPAAPPAATTGYDPAKYHALWVNDPLAAQNYLDAHRFGIPEDQVVPTLTSTVETGNRTRTMLEIGSFHERVPDFPGGNDNAKKLTDFLSAEGKPLTADNLEIAYYRLRAQGAFGGNTPAAGMTTQNHMTTPPPTLTGAGNATTGLMSEEEFGKLSTAQMKEYLQTNGQVFKQ